MNKTKSQTYPTNKKFLTCEEKLKFLQSEVDELIYCIGLLRTEIRELKSQINQLTDSTVVLEQKILKP